MKKLFLGLFVVLALGVNAQIESGKILVGGSFGFGSESKKTTAPVAVGLTKQFSFKLVPEVAYLLSDNLAVGLGYDYTSTTTINFFTIAGTNYDNVVKDGMFSMTPFARYYKQTGDKSFAFGEVSMPIGLGSRKGKRANATNTGIEDDDPTKTFLFGMHLGLGFNYFLNDKCALEAKWAGLGFSSVTTTRVNGALDPVTGKRVDRKNRVSGFDLNLDMTAFTFGIKVFM